MGLWVSGMAAEQLHTMQQAAQRKGFCYHTVSRAVRSGRLPSQRLGRQVLLTPAAFETWKPKRERAPRQYRRAEPDLGAIASSLTQASLDRATLEAYVTALAAAVARSAGSLSLEQLQDVQRLFSQIGFDRKP